MKLGVCYYPEHWPEAVWADDARRMAEMGLSVVRIGEFAWSRIEPEPGRFDWEWLDLAVETLAAQGLKIVMGTPTATPPKWLVDRIPDMVAVDDQGRPRRFGSRRHYCFSCEDYREECRRITTAMAVRYGHHPAVAAWQTDNEYGCHDTTISYSSHAARRFRLWLREKYSSIDRLNSAWGTVFWSQDYRDFSEIDPPHLTVTEANPSHRLDYNRFSSDEVVSFNRIQVDILRELSPGRDISHNFMGFYTEFDHFAVGQDLDVAAWDSYPLGFLEQFWFSDDDKRDYARQGHPDIAAFHHDLYRGCGRGRWWVMEQQPGPVNWAGFNPSPLPGMVRLWTFEALGHGAELVSYFRWRQAPMAQEQMHAGLLRPDRCDAPAAAEVRRSAGEIAQLGSIPPRGKAQIALVFSYEADWLIKIQPQGRDFRWLRLAFEMYSALRGLGQDVDIISPDDDLSGYRLVIVPSLPVVSQAFVDRVKSLNVPVLFGPRSGSKTEDLHIPGNLAPGLLQQILPLKVARVESLSHRVPVRVAVGNRVFEARSWREEIETELEPKAVFTDGGGAWYGQGTIDYLATWPQSDLMVHIMTAMIRRAELEPRDLPKGVRISRRGDLMIAVNYDTAPHSVAIPPGARLLAGTSTLAPADAAVWTMAGTPDDHTPTARG